MASPGFAQPTYFTGQQPAAAHYGPGFHFTGAQASPVPTPPAKPATSEQKLRVDKFIAYLMRVGPDFEAMLREKQQANPEFAFLFGGPDHAYYQWRRWCMQNGWSEEQVEAQLNAFPAASQEAQPPPLKHDTVPTHSQTSSGGSAALSPELEAEFFQFLQNINGSKDTIKNARRWIVKNSASHEARIAELLAAHMQSLQGQSFDRKLHLVYLVSDILHAFLKKREVKTEVDPFCAGLGPHLYAIFDIAFRGHSTEDQDKVVKVVRLWGQRDIYPEVVVRELEAKMKAENHPSPLASSSPLPQQQPPPLSFQQPQQQQPPQHQFAQRPSFPVTPPTSTLHLGPGFIVTLTKDLAPYQPLDPLKVPSHIPPEYITPPDAYTLTRLDKFYAEINEEALRSKSRKSRKSRSRSRSPRKKRDRSRSRSPKRDGGGGRQFAAVPPPKFK